MGQINIRAEPENNFTPKNAFTFQKERTSCLFNASAYERLGNAEIAAKTCILYALKIRQQPHGKDV